LEDLEFKQKWGFEIWPNDLNPFAERFKICPSLLHTVLMAIFSIFSGEHGLANSPHFFVRLLQRESMVMTRVT